MVHRVQDWCFNRFTAIHRSVTKHYLHIRILQILGKTIGKEWQGFENIAENSATYCGKGDIVGVKGRVQSRTVEKEDGKKEYLVEIIAEKITFLSSKKEDKKTYN